MIIKLLVRPAIDWHGFVQLAKDVLGDDPTTRVIHKVQDLRPSISFWDLLINQNESSAVGSCTLLDDLSLGFGIAGDSRIIYEVLSQDFKIRHIDDLYLVLGSIRQWINLDRRKHKPMHRRFVDHVLGPIRYDLREAFDA